MPQVIPKTEEEFNTMVQNYIQKATGKISPANMNKFIDARRKEFLDSQKVAGTGTAGDILYNPTGQVINNLTDPSLDSELEAEAESFGLGTGEVKPVETPNKESAQKVERTGEDHNRLMEKANELGKPSQPMEQKTESKTGDGSIWEGLMREGLIPMAISGIKNMAGQMLEQRKRTVTETPDMWKKILFGS